ncbi:DUF6270 domain-containing protein [Phenylobacterium sp.]|uniref:DUF6270 domain-containing protein n=1 Tax=Phenylobacterium sp. TaxID=1871053 RepID=UPI0028A1CE79|nr:DUF6270 domain-containing protein [Phenylobacterium sp.]
MSRVAVIGSCITRDVWPIVGEAPTDDLLYISRTSLPSLFAPPLKGVEISEDLPPALAVFPHRSMVADLHKSALAALVEHRPTHIIFDFVDERLDLLAVQGTIVTHSWELDVSGYLGQPAFEGARDIPRTSPASDLIWRQGLDQMAALLRMTPLAEAALILHETKWATQYLDEACVRRPFDVVEIFTGKPASIADYNTVLAQHQNAFAAALPQAVRISAPADLHLADSRHRWGLSPFHYVEDYYRDIWRQLQALGV